MKENQKANNKKYGVLVLLLLVVGISIGYAALTTTLNINGNTTIEKASWDVHYENLIKSTGSVEATSEAIIDSNKTTIDYTITLAKPGDFYEFTVDVVNAGTLAAKLASAPSLLGLSEEQDVYTNYTVTYADGTPVAEGDTIDGGASKTIKVRVEYDKNINASDLPTEDQSMTLSYSMSFIQG